MSDIYTYLPSLLDGAYLSLIVAIFSLFFATILGLLAALAKLSNYRVLKAVALFYTGVTRGIPELVWMFLIFYGGQILVNNLTDYLNFDFIALSPFFIGIFAIGFIYGAFLSETFRSAILRIDKGQYEAAHCLGVRGVKCFLKITLPQLIIYAMPGYINVWLVLLKATALLSLIGLKDLIFVSSNASIATGNAFSFFLLASLVYLLITFISLKLLNLLNNKYSFVL